MVGNARTLANDQNKLQNIRQILKKIDANFRSRDNQSISAKLEGQSGGETAPQPIQQRQLYDSYKRLIENIKPFSESVQNP
jgi:hypothetical protein